MSKNSFSQILRTAKLNLTPYHIELYWLKALNADLPDYIFKAIKSELFFLPAVHKAYVNKKGMEPICMTEQYAQRFILDALTLHGSMYMHEFQDLFVLDSSVRISTIEGLIRQGVVKFKYCPIGNAICYELNSEKVVDSQSIARTISDSLRRGESKSLYSIWLYSSGAEYADYCIYSYLLRVNNRKSHIFIYSDLMRTMFKLTTVN